MTRLAFMMWAAGGPAPWSKASKQGLIRLSFDNPLSITGAETAQAAAATAMAPSADTKPAAAGAKNASDDFTPEEDEQLRALKADSSNTWKQIAETMDKPLNTIKKRFGMLKKEENLANQSVKRDNGNDGNAGGNNGNAGEPSQPKKKKDKKGAKAEAASAPAPGGAEVQATAGAEDEDEVHKKAIYVDADDNFSLGELRLLVRLIHADYDELWLRVASAFFDRTGRRIHPLDIMEKFTSGTYV